jgi:Spy/CpxP family protein refolding chaperone
MTPVSDGRCHFLDQPGQAAAEATFLVISRRLAVRIMCHALAFLSVMLVSTQLAAQEVRARLVERFEELNLTDEQEAKIANIQKEGRPKIEAAAKELAGIVKEEVDKVTAVLTPEQKEKLATIREEGKELRAEGLSEKVARLQELALSDAEIGQFQEVRKETRPEFAKALQGLRGTLTEEQQEARQQALQSGKKHREVLASLNLTDAQKEKVLEACKDCRAAVQAELEKLGATLTAQQQEKLAEAKDERRENVRDRMAYRIANLRELNLTEEQLAKIAEIRKEYRPKIQEAGNKLRGAVRDELRAIGDVLKG